MSRTLASMLVFVGCVGAASAQPQRALFVGPNGMVIVKQGQAWTEEQIEGWVFGDNASEARRRLESQLAMQIAGIDRACSLTNVQKKKLQLAGRGDIKRCFDHVDEFKRKVQLEQHDEQKIQRTFQELRRPIRTWRFADRHPTHRRAIDWPVDLGGRAGAGNDGVEPRRDPIFDQRGRQTDHPADGGVRAGPRSGRAGGPPQGLLKLHFLLGRVCPCSSNGDPGQKLVANTFGHGPNRPRGRWLDPEAYRYCTITPG